MRFGFLFEGFSDQITVAQAAGARALGGLNPYGVGYAESSPPGAPFPYGPLALLWWQPGPVVELVAAMGLLALLAWQRAFITLAVLGGWQAAVHWEPMTTHRPYSWFSGSLSYGRIVTRAAACWQLRQP
ncbi:MAG: hypothetical protein M3451_03370 [Chloroflexota bacterium]|nr:hypothetical protein [Chloroflexota bacterium]